MNKKLLLGALVMGMFALNSCVDDKESASVTAIRTAKAEQLKALGEAAKIQADAQAAAANAYAAVQAAQAKLIAAQEAAELANTQIEKEKAAAEIQRLQDELAANIAKTNADIEKIKAEAEAQVLANQAQLLNNQKEQNTELTTLLTQYNNATTTLVTDQRNLVKAQNNLAAWEADLVSWEALRPERIADKQDEINAKTQEIADNDAELATLEQYYGNIAAAKEQLVVAIADQKLLQNKKSAASADRQKAQNDYNSARNKMSGSRYRQILNDSIVNVYDGNGNNMWNQLNYWGNDGSAWYSGTIWRGDRSEILCLYFTINNYSNGQTSQLYIPLYSDKMNTQSITYTYEEGQQQMTTSYTEYPSTYYVFTEKMYNDAIAALNKYVKDNQEAGVTAAQKAYDDFVAAADLVATTNAAKVAADKVVDDVIADGGTPTEAQIADQTAKQAAYNKAFNAYLNAYGWYSEENVANQKENYNNNVESAKLNLANAQAVVAKFMSGYKSLNEQLDTYQGYIAAVNPLAKAQAEASIANSKANYAYNVNQNEISALNGIVNAGNINVWQYEEDGTQSYVTVTIADAMDILKDNQTVLADELADLQEELEEIENEAYESNDGKTEDEKRLALTEAVEDAQMKVDADKKKVEVLKAAIDQLTAEDAE